MYCSSASIRYVLACCVYNHVFVHKIYKYVDTLLEYPDSNILYTNSLNLKLFIKILEKPCKNIRTRYRE